MNELNTLKERKKQLMKELKQIELQIQNYISNNEKKSLLNNVIPIKNYENEYVIDKNSKIYNIKTGKEIKPCLSSNGYMTVSLWKNGKAKSISVHRIVAQTFIPNTNNYSEVNHKDMNKCNNSIENLEWCDRKYNVKYSIHTRKTSMNTNIHFASKKIIQLDMNGNKIQKWNSIKEASEFYNIERSGISKCCRKIIRKFKNYIWEYTE